jgi:hypothetical protein
MSASRELPKFPSDAVNRFQLRLPDGLRDRIARVARQNMRSMNSEMVLILLRAMEDDKDATGAGLPTSTPAASPNHAVFEHGVHQPG